MGWQPPLCHLPFLSLQQPPIVNQKLLGSKQALPVVAAQHESKWINEMVKKPPNRHVVLFLNIENTFY